MAEAKLKRSLFGQGDTEAATTLRDLIAHARWIALDLDTTRFSVLASTSSLDCGRLSLCFDNEHPAISAASRALLGPMTASLLQHSARSTTPCIWTSEVDPVEFSGPGYLQVMEAPVLATPGIAFPVSSSNGQAGIVVFFGQRATLTEQLIFDVHARCFQLFEGAAALACPDSMTVPVASRERDCIELSSHGLTSEEIAVELGLSPHTVNQYLTNTARKLGAVNRVHVVAKALRLGLIV